MAWHPPTTSKNRIAQHKKHMCRQQKAQMHNGATGVTKQDHDIKHYICFLQKKMSSFVLEPTSSANKMVCSKNFAVPTLLNVPLSIDDHSIE